MVRVREVQQAAALGSPADQCGALPHLFVCCCMLWMAMGGYVFGYLLVYVNVLNILFLRVICVFCESFFRLIAAFSTFLNKRTQIKKAPTAFRLFWLFVLKKPKKLRKS
jgi:hypothetical protein